MTTAVVNHPSTFLGGLWNRIDSFRHRDGLVVGTMVTGILAITALGSLAFNGPTAKNLVATVITGTLAKFFGGADGAIKLFTDYFPKACLLNRSIVKPDPTSGPTGIWTGTGIEVRWSHFFDPRLAKEMGDVFAENGVESVWDFGCGPDEYSKAFAKRGITSNGLDGNLLVGELSRGTAYVQELGVPFQSKKRDCVISIEAGAKVREPCAEQFLVNIHAHAKKMAIISWPVPGQKGPNQHNRQPNRYVIERMHALGWSLDLITTTRLRKNSHPIYYWFQDTVMVFRRPSA